MKILLIAFIFSFSAHGKKCEKIETSNPGIIAGTCEDGTISFTNTSSYKGSAKLSKYEGSCGAVASANVFHAYCGRKLISTEYLMREYLGDITPGVRPDTLEEGLNNLFADYPADCANGKWTHYFARSSTRFLENIKRDLSVGVTYWKRFDEQPVSPVIVLISPESSKNLHYVTVVDVTGHDPAVDFSLPENKNSCIVTYNDVRKQRQAPCVKFVEWTSTVNNSLFYFLDA